jgi:hypothetical protein
MGQNIPILVLFRAAGIAESWIISNKCLFGVRPIMSIITAIIIGGLFGLMWASFIVYTGKRIYGLSPRREWTCAAVPQNGLSL